FLIHPLPIFTLFPYTTLFRSFSGQSPEVFNRDKFFSYLNENLRFSNFPCFTPRQASGNSLIKYLTNDIYKQGFSLLMAFLRYPLQNHYFYGRSAGSTASIATRRMIPTLQISGGFRKVLYPLQI